MVVVVMDSTSYCTINLGPDGVCVCVCVSCRHASSMPIARVSEQSE